MDGRLKPLVEKLQCSANPSDSGFDCVSDSGWGKSTSELSFIRQLRQPSTVSMLDWNCLSSTSDLPFIKPRYAVKYKTDGGN